MNKILRYSFFHSLGVVAYVSLIALVLRNGEKWFSGGNEFFAPIAMILLFVLSAAITGALVLGKPILMYFNGEKPEAIKLFLFTLAWLFVFVVIFFLFLTIR
jgi:hypothetical protein